MTDVETKTPPKRKSFSNVQNKKSPAKKAKLDQGKTPQKGALSKEQIKKKSHLQGNAQKFNKKNKRNSESENDSPKKLKPFPGTQSTNDNEGTGNADKKKKERSKQLRTLELKIKSGDKNDAIKTIENRIKEIEGRNEITKTAKRKLKMLKRLQNLAEGKPVGQSQVQKAPANKANLTQGQKKKNAKKPPQDQIVLKKKVTEPTAQVKINGKPNKNVKTQSKLAVKKPVLQQQPEDEEDESDSDEAEGDVQGEESDSGEEEELGEEGVEGESDEESDEEQEAAEEEESDDDSDEGAPPPKVKGDDIDESDSDEAEQDLQEESESDDLEAEEEGGSEDESDVESSPSEKVEDETDSELQNEESESDELEVEEASEKEDSENDLDEESSKSEEQVEDESESEDGSESDEIEAEESEKEKEEGLDDLDEENSNSEEVDDERESDLQEEESESDESDDQEDSEDESDEEAVEAESDEKAKEECDDESDGESRQPIKRKPNASNELPTKKQKLQKTDTDKNTVNKKGTVDLEQLKKNNLVAKNQKRFVLFVGNIPYDTNKHDLIDHFQKSGEIKHIRIPTDRKSSKPRGFAYVELTNEESYQRCLSLHHTSLKGRRINVLYTQGGKKKGEDKKKEIKVKNFKLHSMRKQGQLAGSVKQNQKRSFRRAKQKGGKAENEEL